MKRYSNFATKTIEILVVTILGVMALLVFLNVVLRYGFNSSINITEEVSRYLFIWLTFLGAILAFNDNQHVKVTLFVDKLSPIKKHILHLLTDGLMLFCCYLMLLGAWSQFKLNLSNMAPISGIPTGVNFFACVVASVAIGLLLIIRLVATSIVLIRGEK
ncbi:MULTISPECIES: TRAP transporter small permease [Pasteurellaceae]|nr:MULTISPECIES: TRAP transporter small permease [Pasteurella]MBR0573117.1 TRAP transporter small permease [Pasteurella atlantica]MDP8039026.1 TRAP transporter small permease [Pasteurella atlantica]MDP8041116.1 TRAP transporter small permease [Pasteurella atlantica]MDP8043271.1 TRAP transporter small permease [Pasteurella atlantica]MDP8045357.1 TRAP transporter small permease [Pasteurella atlantica]